MMGRQAVVVADGIDGAPYTSVADITFSPDSKHLVYRALSDKRVSLILDGNPSQTYDDITPPAFSPDGRHHVFAAIKDKSAVIVMDGVEADKTYTGWISGSRPVFNSPDTCDLLMLRDKQILHVRVRSTS